jgi:hypothetical protein
LERGGTSQADVPFSHLLQVVGPCSVHDVKAALEYAKLLKEYADGALDDLHILMRVYFEKVLATRCSSPRTGELMHVSLISFSHEPLSDGRV